MKKFKITNRDEVVEQLAEMMIQFDKDANSYQTDVYLYVDEKGKGNLDTFVNVGGNSWLNDDHYTVYTDKEHTDSYLDTHYQDENDIADVIGVSLDQLHKETKEYYHYDEKDIDDDKCVPTYSEIRKYVSDKEDYCDKLHSEYCSCIDELKPEYLERAEICFDEFEKKQAEIYKLNEQYERD